MAKKKVSDDMLVTYAEAAEIIGRSRAKISQYIKAGVLSPYKNDLNEKRLLRSEVEGLRAFRPIEKGVPNEADK